MKTFTVVLTGNPNCGKTTLFNALTGLRARVGNYAGVTVERKEGALTGAESLHPVTVLDLPGTYSLSPQSPDEQIARDILFQRLPEVPAPDLVVVVADASNLQRNLYFATQVIELGHPTLLVLNMIDVARDQGHEIDTEALSKALGVPVIPMVASEGEGLDALRQTLRTLARTPGTRHVIPREFNELPEAFGREAQALETALEGHFPHRSRLAAAEALLLLSDERTLATDKTSAEGTAAGGRYPQSLIDQVQAARQRLETAGVDWRSAAIEARYARLFAIEQHVTRETAPPGELLSDRIDRVVTHRVWGLLLFVAVMGLMFQSIFWLAKYPMDGIEAAVDALAQWVGSSMPPGDLNDLITRGAIAGVGSVVIFLPQICLLFLFIGLLEDTGYTVFIHI
jgi:ferrous iron transport protein B